MILTRTVAAATAVIALCLTAAPAAAQQSAVRVPVPVLQQYVGEYVYPEGTTLRVTLSGDTLFREDPGRRVPLTPLSESVFRLSGGLTAEFVSDGARGVTMILGNGANMEFRLPRKGSRAVLAPEPKGVPVHKSVLDRYMGDYEYIAGHMSRTDLRVIVRLEGNKLTQRMDTAEERELIPLSETRFAVKGTALVTAFIVDDAGVTIVMGVYGREMVARMVNPASRSRGEG